MFNCNECENGIIHYEENGRMTRNACYCGMSEHVSEELYKLDKLRGVAITLATMEIDNLISLRKENPDGEDWNFLAAEDMMSVNEYTRQRVFESEFRITNELIEMSEWGQNLFIEWNEMIHGIPARAEGAHRPDKVSHESEDDIAF